MPAIKVRSDYEQLNQIAAAFDCEAERTRKSLSLIRKRLQVLEGGDWVGKGATKFYTEMNGQVLPAITRLGAALSQAAATTRKINDLMQQTESTAANLFRLEGLGTVPAIGALGAASPLAGFLSSDPLIESKSGGEPGSGEKQVPLFDGLAEKVAGNQARSAAAGGSASAAGNQIARGEAQGGANAQPASYQTSARATKIPESQWERQWSRINKLVESEGGLGKTKDEFKEKYGPDSDWEDRYNRYTKAEKLIRKYGPDWPGHWVDPTNMNDIKVTRDSGGKVKVLSYKANMAIDTDGAGDAWKEDHSGQPHVTLNGGDSWVNPDTIPYISVPPQFMRPPTNVNAHQGDLVLVRYDGKPPVYAIVADTGNEFKAGEASKRTAAALGIPNGPTQGLDDHDQGVEYIILPGSGKANDIVGTKPDFDQIQEIGGREFAKAKAAGLLD